MGLAQVILYKSPDCPGYFSEPECAQDVNRASLYSILINLEGVYSKGYKNEISGCLSGTGFPGKHKVYLSFILVYFFTSEINVYIHLH